VPVIASNKGALPVTVGAGGQCLPHDIDLWISVMQQIARDAERWRKAGRERFIAYRSEVDAAYQTLKESLMLK
jgi:glycosyltransferase involved in cell wall biosynthesis